MNAANWDLNAAITTFFDSGSIENELIKTDSRVDVDDNRTPQASSSAHPSPHKKPQNKNKFATLSSYQQGDDETGGEEGQAFYAGGSETSGQQILGPNKKKKDWAQNVFDAAKSHGAEVVSEEPPRGASKQHQVFKGTGYTLGSNVEESKQISTSPLRDSRNEGPKKIAIKLWQNGFSINDGPLRDSNDPSNSEFMESIKRGEVPDELRRHSHGGEVHVNLEDHRHEEFVKPKEKMKFFTGTGHTLGSPVPNIVEDPPLPPLAAASSVPSQPTFKVDESKPVTTIQIRLADGTRLVSKFNMHNTVGDIRNVVRNAKAGQGNFNLMTTFPNKVLSNDSESIEAAKLKNAVIVQRMV